jgi:hypothetical protein
MARQFKQLKLEKNNTLMKKIEAVMRPSELDGVSSHALFIRQPDLNSARVET